MQTLKLDDKNNLVIAKCGLAIIVDVDACAQDTRTRIGLNTGEYPYDTSLGLPFFDEILGKMGGADFIASSIRARILDNPEIVSIERIDITRDHNELDITAEVSSIYGVINL